MDGAGGRRKPATPLKQGSEVVARFDRSSCERARGEGPPAELQRVGSREDLSVRAKSSKVTHVETRRAASRSLRVRAGERNTSTCPGFEGGRGREGGQVLPCFGCLVLARPRARLLAPSPPRIAYVLKRV